MGKGGGRPFRAGKGGLTSIQGREKKGGDRNNRRGGWGGPILPFLDPGYIQKGQGAIDARGGERAGPEREGGGGGARAAGPTDGNPGPKDRGSGGGGGPGGVRDGPFSTS